MKNQTLSIEQMQHLQKIGVDTSNASMVLIATDNDGCTLSIRLYEIWTIRRLL